MSNNEEVLKNPFAFVPREWQRELLTAFPAEPTFPDGSLSPTNGLIIASRQVGKTEAAIYAFVYAGLYAEKGQSCLYIAQSLKQSRMIFWPRVKAFLEPIISHCKVSEQLMTIELPNGCTLRALGADNPENARGLSGVCFLLCDEFDSLPESVFAESILPTTASVPNARFLFIGTLKGSQFPLWKLYQANKNNPDWVCRVVKAEDNPDCMSAAKLDQMAESMGGKDSAGYLREICCDPNTPTEHAVLGNGMTLAKTEGRICEVPIENGLELNFAFDLGVRDACSIFAFQLHNQEIRVVAYHEYHNAGLQDIIEDLSQQYDDYMIGELIMPHDINIRDLTTGRSRLDFLYNTGWGNPNTDNGRLLIADSLHAARVNLKRCWFDAERCELGIKQLNSASYIYDDKNRVLTDKILHNASSHALDSFRYAMSWIELRYPDEMSFLPYTVGVTKRSV